MPRPVPPFRRLELSSRARRRFLVGAASTALIKALPAHGQTSARLLPGDDTKAADALGKPFSLIQVPNAVTWERYAVPPFPGSIMGPSPYGGTKHTRWVRRTVDGCWYVLGGDYSLWGWKVSGSGSNLLWKVTPAKPFVFKRLNDYVPPAGQKIPAHVDEAPWMYDSRRDRFLLYPCPRWTTAETPDVIVGHLMFYHPGDDRWEDLGSGKYDPRNNPQLDANGHPYPIGGESDPKWGYYDEVTDKYYMPRATNELLILDAATLAMEWPIHSFGTSPPYQYYDYSWYTACLCFDRVRRRFVTLKAPTNGDLSDPYAYKVLCYEIDTGKYYLLPSNGPPTEMSNPLMLDFEAFVHDERHDLYVCYGGGLRIANHANNLRPTNDLRAIPAEGGAWMKLLPRTAVEPPVRFGQTMHYDPTVKSFFMLGGISDDRQDPEMYFPTIHADALPHAAESKRPAWRNAMAASTWAIVPARNTLADVDPELDPAVNPSGLGKLAPWHGVGGQHMAIEAWNSACYDDSACTLYLGPAGGHADYGGNERYRIRLDADAPAWERFGNPSGCIGNTGILDDGKEASGVYFDGTPRSSHTYNYATYVPDLGPVIARITAPYRLSGDVKKAFSINPSTGAFRLLSDYANAPNSGGIVSVGAACYDATRRCIWMLHTGNVQLQKLDVATGKVTAHGKADNMAAGINWIGHLSEPADALLAVCRVGGTTVDAGINTGLSIFDLRTFSQSALSIEGSFAPGFAGLADGQFVAGIAWDEKRHRLVLWHNETNRGQISTLAPTGDYFRDPWRADALQLDKRNAVIPNAAVPNGTFGRFAFSPTLDGVFLLNGVRQPIYFHAFS
jgi:hypothetical protein